MGRPNYEDSTADPLGTQQTPLEHMQDRVDKFNGWLDLMGSPQRISVTTDSRFNTILGVDVVNVPARPKHFYNIGDDS